MTRPLIIVAVCWIGFLGLLGFVPWLAGPDAQLPNVAAMLGYDIGLAYKLVVVWSVGMACVMWLWGRAPSAHEGAVPVAAAGKPWVLWGERIAVALAVVAVYWPASLARFGPHVEDQYFLNILWRMQCGDVPYSDFEFLYGPLMIGPLGAWMSAFGFSMASYFAFYALVQVAFFVGVVWLFQRWMPKMANRYFAYLVMVPFLVDHLLGLNWIAARYFVVVPLIFYVARAPLVTKTAIVAGVIVGVQTAYSYEYGALAMAALVAMMVSMVFQPARLAALRNIAILLGVAAVTWALIVWAILGAGFGDYLSATALVAANAAAQGLGQFAFYWTLHTAALFVLLSVAIVMGGAILRRLGRMVPTAGDLQIIGASVFALGALKIALQRADFYHMIVPFVALAIVILVNRPLRLAYVGSGARRVALVALCVASVAQAFAHVPLGRWIAFSSVRGATHELTGRPTVGPIEAPLPTIHSERSFAQEHILAIAARFNKPDLNGRPAIFYAGTWDRAMSVGVCPVGYAFYDILYADAMMPLKQTAAQTEELVVVIKQGDFAMLTGAAPTSFDLAPPQGLARVAQIISSAHLAQTRFEERIEYDIWKAHLGDNLVSDFRVLDRVADVLILEKTIE